MKIKDIPSDDRPYERCLREGPKRLSDAELLSIIIRTGSHQSGSLELASQVLALNYPKDGILGLLHLSIPDLMELKGIGRVKAIQLSCIGELSRRIWKKAAGAGRPVLKDPEEIAQYCMEDMRHLEQEEIRALFFDTKQRLLQDVVLSKGTVDSSVISPREIFIQALRCGAVTLILVHNHPSGDSTPSQEDCLLTRKVSEAGSLVDIQLLDHVVIGDNNYCSFKKEGML